ncbi:MAG: peptidase, partial [Muribaculaceae bacterium]|nr:peptidase [Muribaculaceae bacterium]
GQSRKFTEPARDYFLKKGARELPMVENLYQQYVNAGNEEEAAALLTDYSRDYFGAAVGRWDDLGRRLWYQHWKGF